MDREKLDGWCERGIFGLVLAILAFGPLALGAVDQWAWLVIQGLTIGVLILWAARLWLGERPRLLWPPVCWAVVGFVIYSVIRYFQADLEYVARGEVLRILVYTFLFFAVLNNLHRQESAQIIAVALVFLGMAIAFYACWQFATKSSRVWFVLSPYEGRASGTFIYPNSLAAFLEMLVPLALALGLMSRLSHLMRILVTYCAFAMLAGIAVTFSRGGWLVAAASLLVFCGVLFSLKEYRIHAVVMAIVLMVVGYKAVSGVDLAQQRFAQAVSSGKADDVRLSIWRTAYAMWQDHRWVGVGPAHFDYRFREYRPVEVQRRPNRVHNDYLNTLVDWGVVGAGLMAAIWGALVYGILRTAKAVRRTPNDLNPRRSTRFGMLAGASLGLLAIAMHSALDFNLQIPGIAIMAVAFVALLSGQTRFATERYWVTLGSAGRAAGTLVLLAGVVVLGWTEFRGAQECKWLLRASKEPELSPRRVEALEAAWKVEPANFDTTYAVGEYYRNRSFEPDSADADGQARKAMEWYERGMKLNPYDGYNWLRYGMCLDRIGPGRDGKPPESDSYYNRADSLDPNGYFTAANIGWHYTQLGDFAAARTWLERSRRLEWVENEIVEKSLPFVERRLKSETERRK
jgi:O-antigen ligase